MHSEKVPATELKSDHPQSTEFSNTLILDLAASRAGRNKILVCFLSQPVAQQLSDLRAETVFTKIHIPVVR